MFQTMLDDKFKYLYCREKGFLDYNWL